MLRLLPVLLLSACVVRYGPRPGSDPSLMPAEPLPPPVDFDEVSERLEKLMVDAENTDQRDRLDLAHGLARRMRDEDPRAQRVVLGYLRDVVQIEERGRPVEGPGLYPGEIATFILPGEQVVEEALDVGEPDPDPTPQSPDSSPAATPAAPPADAPTESGVVGVVDLGAVRADAGVARAAGDLDRVLRALERCRNKACWDAVQVEWAETRDVFVRQQREAAGVAFLRARDEPDPKARLEAMNRIRQRLADLVDRYPDSPQADDLRRNVELVQRAIEGATPAAGGGTAP